MVSLTGFGAGINAPPGGSCTCDCSCCCPCDPFDLFMGTYNSAVTTQGGGFLEMYMLAGVSVNMEQ
jgi:hypothetical protein